MSDVTTESAVAYRCKIDEVFGGPFIELINLAPKNPVVRGLILAQTGKMPGAERQTFEAIKEWVETTCDKNEVRLANPPRASGAAGFTVSVDFSETEYGRANYSVPRSGSDDFALAADELLEMAQKAIDAGGGLDRVIEDIALLIDEEAWSRCEPHLDNYGDYDYEDHNSGESDNLETEFSRTQIRERLLTFLQQRHPDLLEELT